MAFVVIADRFELMEVLSKPECVSPRDGDSDDSRHYKVTE